MAKGRESSADQQAAGRLLHLKFRTRIGFEIDVAVRAFVHRIVVEVEAVQRRDVARVDRPLERLQVVAVLEHFGNVAMVRRRAHELLRPTARCRSRRRRHPCDRRARHR